MGRNTWTSCIVHSRIVLGCLGLYPEAGKDQRRLFHSYKQPSDGSLHELSVEFSLLVEPDE